MIGAKIIALRERKGFSQADLADRMDMKRAQLCNIERGRYSPTTSTLARIAKALGVAPDDLLADDLCPCGELVPTSRAIAGLVKAKAEARLQALEMNALEDAHGVVSATTLPLVHAYLRQPHASEILAASLRDSLRVGMAAFTDLVWTLEFANIRVLVLDLPQGVDSAGWWDPDREALMIAVSKRTTPERQLYRLAYELGAACLFRSSGGCPIKATKAEHRFLVEFAADFLMPAAAVADMVAKTGIAPQYWTFPQLLTFKSHFGVSAETFALRLEELGLIDKALRENFRARLRAFYRAHPNAMEPESNKCKLCVGQRARLLRESVSVENLKTVGGQRPRGLEKEREATVKSPLLNNAFKHGVTA